MTSQKPYRSAGFTIIETMIVLAIAGLILMLVFEAIPALERNSRNNQRRQDVQTILENVSHYELNNSGDIPTTVQLQSDLSSDKLTYYDVSNVAVTFTDLDTSAAIPANTEDIEHVQIYNHAKCDPTQPGSATNSAAGYSDVVALYGIESGSTHINPQCQQL